MDDDILSSQNDELRGLIIRYMEACNDRKYSIAEAILKQIEQLRE